MGGETGKEDQRQRYTPKTQKPPLSQNSAAVFKNQSTRLNE